MACVRVLALSAAFPTFNNVDEPAHFDVICKYADGRIPRDLEPYSSEAIEVLAWHSTPEYLTPPDRYATLEVPTPPEELPPEKAIPVAGQLTESYTAWPDPECTQPPVYYAVAGQWRRLGELLGLTDIRLVYWIRFLNALIFGLLVWTAYACVRRLFPGSPLIHAGVPLMLAFFPQDVFYGMNNDVLSPLVYTAAFYSLLRIYGEDRLSYRFHAAAGLAVAAVLLVKVSNITILAPMCLILAAVLKRARSDGRLRETLPRVGLTVTAALIPVSAWMVAGCLAAGDPFGVGAKADYFGWTYKPLGALFEHPIFTAAGAGTFLSELTARFWRGEITWHMAPMAMREADYFYVASTALFIGAAVLSLFGRRRERASGERFAGWMGVSAVAASVAMMAALSINFDFGECFYPSAAFPYFVSGRLILGVLVPFLVLYVQGLDVLMTRLRLRTGRLAVLMVIVALITASEIALELPVFRSQFNWFHV